LLKAFKNKLLDQIERNFDRLLAQTGEAARE
jgi:hypothetical protein